MSELSEPLENYLKEIYELEETKGHAKVVDLIDAFSISLAQLVRHWTGWSPLVS